MYIRFNNRNARLVTSNTISSLFWSKNKKKIPILHVGVEDCNAAILGARIMCVVSKKIFFSELWEFSDCQRSLLTRGQNWKSRGTLTALLQDTVSKSAEELRFCRRFYIFFLFLEKNFGNIFLKTVTWQQKNSDMLEG